jgi:hypothetical protein
MTQNEEPLSDRGQRQPVLYVVDRVLQRSALPDQMGTGTLDRSTRFGEAELQHRSFCDQMSLLGSHNQCAIPNLNCSCLSEP